MNVLRKLLVFVLVVIIVGGLGYIGYSMFYTDHSGHLTGSTQKTGQGGASPVTPPTSQPTNSGQLNNPSAAFAQQNRDTLVKAIGNLNEAISLMTVDPYAPGKNEFTSSAGTPGSTGSTNVPNNPVNSPQTINIYPQNNQSVNILPSAASGANPVNNQNIMPMSNNGVTVDQQKMQQLHSGLFKLSQGMAILGQLSDSLGQQAEDVSIQGLSLPQQYSLLHNQTVQNRSRLNEAMAFVNEATTLVNVNPYQINGASSYERDKMNQVHEGVMKLAQGSALLNQLNEVLANQAIFAANNATQTQHAPAAGQTGSAMNGTQAGALGGLFQSLATSGNLTVVFNLILILLLVGLIVGIAGAIYSLIKGPTKENQIS